MEKFLYLEVRMGGVLKRCIVVFVLVFNDKVVGGKVRIVGGFWGCRVVRVEVRR